MYSTWQTTSVAVLLAVGILTTSAALTNPGRSADPPKKAKEAPFAVVLQAVFLAPKESRRLQMTTKLAMRSIVNDNDAVLNVQAMAKDPTTALLTARKPGLTRITLTDAEGKQEGFLVLVAAPQPGGALPGRVVPRGPEGGFSTVLVANEDIPVGTVIRRPQDLFKRVHYVKEGHEPQDVIRDFEQLRGKRLKRALAEDQPVKDKDLAN
jgi:flagella basal body P-ring formation protein FlgA